MVESDIREVRGVSEGCAERRPLAEESGVGVACLAAVGSGGESQSSADINVELCLDAR